MDNPIDFIESPHWRRPDLAKEIIEELERLGFRSKFILLLNEADRKSLEKTKLGIFIKNCNFKGTLDAH